MRNLASLLSLLIIQVVFGQTCSIQSDSIVCKGEVISFVPVINGGTASGYSWDFDDGTSSTQGNVSHTYSQTGSKTVSLTITLSGGGTCVSTKNIFVHDVPKPNFNMAGSDFCISKQKICLLDMSNMGQTTSGYDTRIILWGDGDINSNNNPSYGDNICYQAYDKTGTYTISIEVKNDKGCEAKWEKMITILQDYIPNFTVQKKSPGCNEQVVCFVNEDEDPPAGFQSIEWDFGDGSKKTSGWDSVCHRYTNNGNITVALKVRLSNGCVNTVTKTINLTFPKVETSVFQFDSIHCYPQPFRFSNPLVPGSNYVWELYDSNQNFIANYGFSLVQNIYPPYPGDFYVRLKISKGSCSDHSAFYKIASLGVDASFIAFNTKQCERKDTVYFKNETTYHPNADPHYIWSFKDKNITGLCSTWRLNCNYDTSEHSRHFYVDTGCYTPTLYAYDPVSGCVDSFKGQVNLVEPFGAKFTHELNLPCIGQKTEYAVKFDNNLCDAGIRVVFDSCTDKWLDYRSAFLYDSVCNDDGWVTVGFAVVTGDSVVYRSHDPNDYYIDLSRICYDTIYYHNWFQLHPEPLAEFEFLQDSCLPAPVELRYTAGEEDKIEYIQYTFGDGGDMLKLYPDNDTFPFMKHIYTEEGAYQVIAQVIDSFGCYDTYVDKDLYGYFNAFFNDSVICIGEEVEFIDSIRYWNDPIPYWNHPLNKEKIYWDFGDGMGISDSGHAPVFQFNQKGIFTVTMYSNDKKGCRDTFSKQIFVGGVEAGIKSDGRPLLCDQIIQFFDSSRTDFDYLGDSIETYFWDFGDGTIASYKKNPFHLYKSNRNFTITHIVTGLYGCTDTAYLEVEFVGPKPYFEIITDSVGCAPFTATVRSLSSSVSDFIWSMGDPGGTTFSYNKDTSVTFTYNQPGTYYIYLQGLDSFYNADVNNYYTCSAIYPDTVGVMNPILKRIIVLPIPAADFDYTFPLCKGKEMVFTNTSNPRYDEFKWVINADTFITTDNKLRYTPIDTGSLDIAFYPVYTPMGIYEKACFDSAYKNLRVTDVIADFTIVKDQLCSYYTVLDSSYNAFAWEWDFGHPQSGDNNKAFGISAEHDYGLDTGKFNICMIASNKEGCKDTICKDIHAIYTEFASIYNVFTPNNDNLNDDFGMDIINPELYDLKIYNRWGELVFDSRSQDIRWNGKLFNTGAGLPGGEYMYIFEYSFICTGERYSSHGIVELIRD